MKRPHWVRSLKGKMNILIVGIILVIAAGLMSIAYYVFCQKVDDSYNDAIERATSACLSNIDPHNVEHLWKVINSNGFRDAHDRAAAAGDEEILRDWMRGHLSYVYDAFDDEELASLGLSGFDIDTDDLSVSLDPDTFLTFLDDYESITNTLQAVMDFTNVDAAYLQFDVDGNTYNLADPTEDLLYIGSIEEPLEAFASYGPNSSIPPTVYRSSFGWLCTAMEPFTRLESDEVIAAVGVDIDMTEIVRERYAFLLNSLLFVLVQLAIAIPASMMLVNRIAVKPLHDLAEATTGFAAGDRVFTQDDVIRLDIRSQDEIGELYHEIQSMQSRIVDYTENLTRVTAEKERVSTELRTAAQIQESMLPDIFPAFPNRTDFDLYASMDPAKEVGGDFYDFFMVDDDHLALLIADVSDKGVPAALFMMSAKILLNYRAQEGGTPAEILNAVNAVLCRSNSSRMFVTVWLGILELSTGRLTCSNAGHEYPVIRGQDGVFRVLKDKHGLVLGALPRAKYTDYALYLQPGDAIFVYTDGIPEAGDTAGTFYGMDRMEATLNTLAGRDPRGILEGMRADVAAFAGEAVQSDDLTMLCLEYRGPQPAESSTDTPLRHP